MIHFMAAIFTTLVCVHYSAHHSSSMVIPVLNICVMIMAATISIVEKIAEITLTKHALNEKFIAMKYYIDALESKSKETQTSDKCASERDETPSASSAESLSTSQESSEKDYGEYPVENSPITVADEKSHDE